MRDESVPGMVDMVARVEEFLPEQEPELPLLLRLQPGACHDGVAGGGRRVGRPLTECLRAAMSEFGTISFDGLAGDYDYDTSAETATRHAPALCSPSIPSDRSGWRRCPSTSGRRLPTPRVRGPQLAGC